MALGQPALVMMVVVVVVIPAKTALLVHRHTCRPFWLGHILEAGFTSRWVWRHKMQTVCWCVGSLLQRCHPLILALLPPPW